MAQAIKNVSKVLAAIKSVSDDQDLSNYGKEFQLKLLSLLIKDRVFSSSIIPIMKNEYFTDIYLRKVFVVVEKFMRTYTSTLPTIDNIRITLHQTGENMQLFDKILKSIDEITLADRDFVINNARDFCFSKHALHGNDEIRKLLEVGNFKDAQAISADLFRYSGLHTTKIYDLKKDIGQIFVSKTIKNPVPTPFPTFNDKMDGGPGAGNLVVMVAPSNFGKSFLANTRVRMYDCSLKNIQDIVPGELVMGWDGKPRTVDKCHSGVDQMYRIDQSNGDSYTVNSRHELCILNSWDKVSAENVQLMNAVQYLDRMKSPEEFTNKKNEWNAKWREHNRGFKSPGIDFDEQELPIDPYWLGLWLGDGYKRNTEICGVDEEVGDYLTIYCEDNNLELVNNKYYRSDAPNNKILNRWKVNGDNFIKCFIKDYNLFNNKHIPEIFLYNSKENRLRLLAGLIDTDGGLGVLKTSVEITQKLDVLAEQITFLCRSLGLKVSLKKKEGKIDGVIKGIYNRIIVSGKELINVPTLIYRKKFTTLKTKKDELKTRIKITPVGEGEYFGFSIKEEDKMFLLEDFTVVHNTNALVAVARHANSVGKNVAFFSFEIGGIDILRRHVAGLTDFTQREVVNNQKIVDIRLSDEYLGDFKLIEEKATIARISTIKTHLDYLKSIGFFPDLICIDSLNQLKLPVGMRYEGDNQKFEYLSEELRDLAKDEGVPLYTVFQTNRGGFSKELNDIESIGKAIEPFQVADVVITFSQTKPMIPQQKCYTMLLKNRLGPKHIVLDCHYDPDKCVFDEVAVVNELLLLEDEQKNKIKNAAKGALDKLRDRK